MEQKFESLKKENPEQLKEYFEFINSSVKDGSYFKDGLNWYFFRYVNPFCERTIVSVATVFACIICYFLAVLIQGAFPLVEKDPIIISAIDQSKYFPNLIPLKPHQKGPASDKYDPAIKTVDEAILKYLLTVYVKDREGYDFRDSKIEDVNTKFNHIRNNSSQSEYREFQLLMSKDNPNSPILNFGQNIFKTVEVNSVKFIKKESVDFADRAKDFIVAKIPSQAEVRFTTTTISTDDSGLSKTQKANYLAKINFTFSGVVKQENAKNNQEKSLGFLVKNYKLYKVN